MSWLAYSVVLAICKVIYILRVSALVKYLKHSLLGFESIQGAQERFPSICMCRRKKPLELA